jgi:hypothetical protein
MIPLSISLLVVAAQCSSQEAVHIPVQLELINVESEIWDYEVSPDCDLSVPLPVGRIVNEGGVEQSAFLTILAIDIFIVFFYLIAKLVVSY